jgi:Uncharacterised nucleotidyltransferase
MKSLAERAHVWSTHEKARLVLRAVLEELDRNRVPVLPVKGILTARLLYADPSDRPIQDIDLRVRPEDLALVRRAGERAGWRVQDASRAYNHLSFTIDGLLVELEGHVGPRGMSSLTVAEMLDRARLCEAPFGFEHLQPELHDHFLLMVVNAFKDKMFEALERALRDLELFAARPDFDPLRLAALARGSDLATLTSIAATWMVEERNDAHWGEVVRALGRPPRPVYAMLMKRVLHRGSRTSGDRAGLTTRLLTRAASDSRLRQIGATWTMVRWVAERHRA